MIDLRPARPDDYTFSLTLYLETIEPYASEWFSWVPEEQEAQFSDLWRPDDTRIIVLDGNDVGWVEIRQTGDEIFLKQLYVAPAYQGQGIGSQVVLRLLDDWTKIATSMALFVFKNNRAVQFYERLGFSVVRETPTKFVMRRAITEWARRSMSFPEAA
jgi:ribosomal protein S18 acetylase RimI-like enzyme